jgi:hypothetical protein
MSRRPNVLIVLAALLAGGCAGRGKTNPSFDVSMPDARRAMREMAHSPRPLERPVVVLDGMGPPLASAHLASALRRTTGDLHVIGVQFAFCFSLEDCRRRVIEAVERQFPSDDPEWTTEVDVIAHSMGGVVGRCAAAPLARGDGKGGAPGKRLKVARLFTISSPHRGSVMASALPPLLGAVQVELREGSSFLHALGEREEPARYELVAYVRLGDVVVGDANASPDGLAPHWLSTPPLQDAHTLAFADPRIIADIARRLRGESPFATDPPAPLPG